MLLKIQASPTICRKWLCFYSKTLKKKIICPLWMGAKGARKKNQQKRGRIFPCEQYHITYALEIGSTRAGE